MHERNKEQDVSFFLPPVIYSVLRIFITSNKTGLLNCYEIFINRLIRHEAKMPIVSDLLFELETVARPGFNIENKYSIARFSLLSRCGYRSVSVCQESIQQACLRKVLRNKWCKSFTSVCFQCVRIELKCLIFVSNRKFSKRLQKKKPRPERLMLTGFGSVKASILMLLRTNVHVGHT